MHIQKPIYTSYAETWSKSSTHDYLDVQPTFHSLLAFKEFIFSFQEGVIQHLKSLACLCYVKLNVSI